MSPEKDKSETAAVSLELEQIRLEHKAAEAALASWEAGAAAHPSRPPAADAGVHAAPAAAASPTEALPAASAPAAVTAPAAEPAAEPAADPFAGLETDSADDSDAASIGAPSETTVDGAEGGDSDAAGASGSGLEPSSGRRLSAIVEIAESVEAAPTPSLSPSHSRGDPPAPAAAVAVATPPATATAASLPQNSGVPPTHTHRPSAPAEGDRVLYLIRHAESEMNQYLASHDVRSATFTDPLLWDARLTADGRKQATKLAEAVAGLDPKPEVVLCSPLSRALQTAETAFRGMGDAVRREVLPLAREHVSLASEIGRPAADLRLEFPSWDFGDIPAIWWYSPPGARWPQGPQKAGALRQRLGAASPGGAPAAREVEETEEGFGCGCFGGTKPAAKASPAGGLPTRPDFPVESEPLGEFQDRMIALFKHLKSRPERCLALVAHSAVLHVLCGEVFKNAEMRRYRASDLVRPQFFVASLDALTF